MSPPKNSRPRTYYENFVKQFNSKKPARVYAVTGDEEFLKWKATDLLLDKLVDPSTRDFNYDCYAANEATAGDIISACNNMPFGPGHKVVRVTNCNRMSTSYRNQLAAYLPKIPEQTTLIMHFGLVKMVSKFFSAVAKNGVFIDCRAPWPSKIGEYVNLFLRERKIQTAGDIPRALVSVIGTDLYSLYNEVHKLSLILKQDEQLTPNRVKEFCAAGNMEFVDEYLDALGKKKIDKVMRLANIRTLQAEELMEAILRADWMFKTLYDGLTSANSSMDGFFRKRVIFFKVNDYIGYTSNFGREDIEKIFNLLFYVEWEAKLNPTPPQQLLQVMGYYICNIDKYDGRNPFPGIGKLN
ncbi:MAG: DNA polymerase III subunit delta [candidate division Zixibacteria bacterium]|nr:DNA polymerase III subunit delta [candidate division Zixibacteria bacterium]